MKMTVNKTTNFLHRILKHSFKKKEKQQRKGKTKKKGVGRWKTPFTVKQEC